MEGRDGGGCQLTSPAHKTWLTLLLQYTGHMTRGGRPEHDQREEYELSSKTHAVSRKGAGRGRGAWSPSIVPASPVHGTQPCDHSAAVQPVR